MENNNARFFPKTLHPLHIFEEDNVLYAADLEKASVVEMRERLSEKARERAVSFTWDKTARRIVELFEGLHRKKQLMNPNRLLNVFAPTQSLASEAAKECRLLKS